MIRWLRSLALGVLLVLGATGAAGAQVATAQAADDASPHQVLLILDMPAAHASAAGQTGGGYGDQGGRTARRRIAVKLARRYGLQLVDGWPMPLLGVDCYILAVPDGRSSAELAERLGHEPGVREAQASHVFHTQGAPVSSADPMYWAQPAAKAWRLGALHELATGRGVRVAVVDSMVDGGHPDLVGQIDVLQNFVAGRAAVPEAHGTAVAGIIAARANNGIGIMGVAPGAKVMGLRACWQPASRSGAVCDSLSLAKALHYAIEHHAEVINLSLAGPPDPLLAQLIDVATARGIRVVAAYDRNMKGGGFPASHRGVVAVAEQSVAAPAPGVYSAPGRDVPAPQPGGKWFLVDGSSYAAAQVSGLLALVSERQPVEQKTPDLVASKTDGEIDACASLLRVSHKTGSACARTDRPG